MKCSGDQCPRPTAIAVTLRLSQPVAGVQLRLIDLHPIEVGTASPRFFCGIMSPSSQLANPNPDRRYPTCSSRRAHFHPAFTLAQPTLRIPLGEKLESCREWSMWLRSLIPIDVRHLILFYFEAVVLLLLDALVVAPAPPTPHNWPFFWVCPTRWQDTVFSLTTQT